MTACRRGEGGLQGGGDEPRSVAWLDAAGGDVLGRPLTPGERKALTDALEKVLTQITSDRAHADLICRLCDLAACPQSVCPVELAAAPPRISPRRE